MYVKKHSHPWLALVAGILIVDGAFVGRDC